MTEGVEEKADVIRAVLHAVGPIFEVEVHGDTDVGSTTELVGNVGDVLLGRFAELTRKMAQGTFAKEVHGAAAGFTYPVEGAATVDETEYLEAVKVTGIFSPLSYAANGL